MIAPSSSKTLRELILYAPARGTDAYGMVNAGATASEGPKKNRKETYNLKSTIFDLETIISRGV